MSENSTITSYAVHICREPIVLKGRLWIKQQQNEGQLSNQSTSGLGESSSSKLGKLKNPAKYNSSNGGFASQGGLFAGKDTVQKQIKDALKANLKRPNEQFGGEKKMRFPTKDLTKQTDIGFSGEKAMGAHIEDTSLKNLMKEITFSSQRPTSPETGCDDILSNILNHMQYFSGQQNLKSP